MGDTRSVTIALAAGEGNFGFTQLEPVQPSYKEGDSVYVRYTVKNNGAIASGATIDVKDAVTGAAITSFAISEIPPGYQFATTGSHAYVGKMPNKSWALQFVLKP